MSASRSVRSTVVIPGSRSFRSSNPGTAEWRSGVIIEQMLPGSTTKPALNHLHPEYIYVPTEPFSLRQVIDPHKFVLATGLRKRYISRMSIFNGLGRALRWLRDRQGKRQYQVADAAGITKAMLSAYETGKQKPSLDTLEKILVSLE